MTEIADTHVKAIKNDQEFEVTADVVVLSIGVAQETELAKNCGLRIGKSGGIQVNPNYQTNDPNIYAVGDAVPLFGTYKMSPIVFRPPYCLNSGAPSG